ncbi:hypothetical protein F5Y05DRAFT_166897 [Hypoxylon sp. FL0543]|nr:hypothetical protein F5Y05DRAFT_166897 [Hypoxylon sp. FL0543]
MKHPNSPQGRFYNFKPRHEWKLSEDDTRLLEDLPKIVRKHMVVVVDKAFPGWVKVTTTVDESIDNDLYVPIRPTPKNRNTKMQLKIADEAYGYNGLPYRSYLRVDKIYSVPREILVDASLELQTKSYGSLGHFMRERGLG